MMDDVTDANGEIFSPKLLLETISDCNNL